MSVQIKLPAGPVEGAQGDGKGLGGVNLNGVRFGLMADEGYGCAGGQRGRVNFLRGATRFIIRLEGLWFGMLLSGAG